METLLAQYPMTTDDVFDSANRLPFSAILDAAGAPAVPDRMDEPDVESLPLYQSNLHLNALLPGLRSAAPYLARTDLKLMGWIQDELWNDPWGILIESRRSLRLLRTHFRRFLLVRDGRDREVCFRFYDPRVLARFLPACNDDELTDFFGPVTAYIARGDDPDSFTRYALRRRSARQGSRRRPTRDGGKRATEPQAETEPSFSKLRDDHTTAFTELQDQAAAEPGQADA